MNKDFRVVVLFNSPLTKKRIAAALIRAQLNDSFKWNCLNGETVSRKIFILFTEYLKITSIEMYLVVDYRRAIIGM